MYIGDMFLLIGMACKTKMTLKRAQMKKNMGRECQMSSKSGESKKEGRGRQQGWEKKEERDESTKRN